MAAVAHRLRYGMIGGGLTGLIGAAHRISAAQHGLYELVAGAFSSDAQTAHDSAASLHIDPARSYEDFHELAKCEAQRDDGIEAVVIVTPNDLHAAPAVACAQAGIDVICDKPMAATLEQTEQMAQKIKDAGVEFILTHNYSGYPLVRAARQMVAEGRIGEVRQVRVEYLQDGLLGKLEARHKWRSDPQRCGNAGTLADIGSHAYHLLRFVIGADAASMAADTAIFTPQRGTDDHVEILLRYANGARGSMTCSQVSAGKKCDLQLHVYGELASLHWGQESPNELLLCPYDAPQQVFQRGMSYLGSFAQPAANIAAGHTEGYYEAFAQIYRDAHTLITARRSLPGSDDVARARQLVPGLDDGLAVARFIAAALQSADSSAGWVELASVGSQT